MRHPELLLPVGTLRLQDTSALRISTSPWHCEVVIALHDPPKAAAGGALHSAGHSSLAGPRPAVPLRCAVHDRMGTACCTSEPVTAASTPHRAAANLDTTYCTVGILKQPTQHLG